MSTDLNLLECVELIEETKENSKNALIEKGLEIDESYGLSQVDEKIAEIQAGTDVTQFYSTYIEKVELSEKGKNDFKEVKFGEMFDARSYQSTDVTVRVTTARSCYITLYSTIKQETKGGFDENNVYEQDISLYNTGSYSYCFLYEN